MPLRLPLTTIRFFHEAFEAANDHRPAADLEQLDDHHQPIARHDAAAELDFFQAAEADDFGPQEVIFLHKVAGQLGGDFTDDDAGHQRGLGHVAANPEFIERHILVAGANLRAVSTWQIAVNCSIS